MKVGWGLRAMSMDGTARYVGNSGAVLYSTVSMEGWLSTGNDSEPFFSHWEYRRHSLLKKSSDMKSFLRSKGPR